MKTKAFTKIWAPALGVALALLAGAEKAGAATLQYTATVEKQRTNIFTYIDLTKFDTNLGTLTKVEISLGSNLDTVLTIKNTAADTSTGNAKTHIVLGLSDPNSLLQLIADKSFPSTGLQQTGYQYELAGGTVETPTTLVSPTLTSSASDYQAFTASNIITEFSTNGAGVIPLYLQTFTETVLANTGGNTSVTQVTNADATVQVTYTYTPVTNVPEPTTWAMMLGGVGMLAFSQRLRRRS